MPLVLWATLIFAASSIPGTSLPQSVLWSFDKVIHAVIFFVLGFLSFRAFTFLGQTRGWKSGRILLVSILFCLVYAASDETHQYFVPMRSSDINDFLADSAGIILAHGLFLKVRLL